MHNDDNIILILIIIALFFGSCIGCGVGKGEEKRRDRDRCYQMLTKDYERPKEEAIAKCDRERWVPKEDK